MTDLPFSARHRGVHRQIDASFPDSARNGLTHLLCDLVEKGYVDGWGVTARELRRIGRRDPVQYERSSPAQMEQAKKDTETALMELSWDKVYDFCERLHNHLAQASGYWWNDEFEEKVPKAAVLTFISEELQRLFAEEGLAFEFVDEHVLRRGRKHTVDQSTKAQVVLGDPRLASARRHYGKALQFFRDPKEHDFENAVKESVCAVEAAGKTLFPMAKASTLGDLAKWFVSTKEVSAPKALVQTITGIYGYRNGGDGVAHGGSAGGAASAEVAEY